MQPENDVHLEKGYLSQITPLRKETSFIWENVYSFLNSIKPAFLSIYSNPRPSKLRRTAYLDGIRGFAALLVYLLHHLLWAHAFLDADVKLENSFGFDGQYYLGAFWGLRTVFTGGHYAVSTFFVLSGYVLSAKPLALIMAGEHGKLNENVASALFRRWLRLYLPIIAITLMLISFYHITGIPGIIKPQRTFRGELWKWYSEGKNWTFVWNMGGDPWYTYHPHTWSIPVEMKGSIVIYTAILAFSRCSTRGRIWGELGLMTYFMYIADGAHFAMFMAGMFLCDIDTLEANGKLPAWITDLRPHKTQIFTTMFAVSVFLGGVPSQQADYNHFKKQPGWYLLSLLKPQAVFDYKWFYLFWAAFLLVASVPRLPWLKAFFENRFNQYLAKISYGFYLVHGPVLWILGDRLYCAVGYYGEQQALSMPEWVNRFPLPRWGPFGLEFNYLACHIILLPCTFWLAELCTEFIDNPSINFTRWLYSKFQAEGPTTRDSTARRA